MKLAIKDSFGASEARNVLGSEKAGSQIPSTTITTVKQSLDAFVNGISGSGKVVNNALNQKVSVLTKKEGAEVFYILSEMIKANQQDGILEWNADIEFFIGGFTRVDYDIYRSKVDNNKGNAVTDLSKWDHICNFAGATTTQKGVSKLATTTEIFNKDVSVVVTPETLFTSPFNQKFIISLTKTGLSQLVNTGTSLNLLSLFLASDESVTQQGSLVFKDKSNVDITNFLNATTNRFFCPSNLYTANKVLCNYDIRVSLRFTKASGAGTAGSYSVRIKRGIDNTVIPAGASYISVAETENDPDLGNNVIGYGTVFKGFVSGEADPFINDGLYIDFRVPTNSSNATLSEVRISFFGSF